MPEMPEVAALASSLARRTHGLRIARADVAAISALKTVSPPVTDLNGAWVLGWGRSGKFLVCNAVSEAGEPLHLVVHLARGGWVRWRDEVPLRPAGIGRGGGRSGAPALALRLVLVDEQGQPAGGIDFTEAGTQKRLACYVVRELGDVPGVAALGPDPLGEQFTPAVLDGILAAAGRAQLKGVLREQSRIAGIGNAYSDEILHVARLSPFAPAAGLDEAARARLAAAITDTLTGAVAAAQEVDPTSLKSEKRARMRVHGRAGEPCATCGDTIREVSFADSSLQYCPTCQTNGKLLADRRMSRLLK